MRTLARWRLLIIAAVLSGTPSRALAYRPFVSTDAAVAGPGEVEIEFGYAGFRWNVAELNGESVRQREADNSALVGAIWEIEAPAPLHGLSLDVGVRHAISRAADEWGGTAGFTVAFPW